jgi:hypothetical protein
VGHLKFGFHTGVADAPFDFSSLYNVLGDAFGTARPDGAVDRALVVFGRSRAVPVATGEFELKSKGDFFLDAIYLHENAAPPVRDVQAVYTALLNLLTHRSSYVMETTRSQEKLKSYLLLLLAHPILRDAQDAALAKLDPEAATSGTPTSSPGRRARTPLNYLTS